MSSSRGAARRSGDPRRRRATARPAAGTSPTGSTPTGSTPTGTPPTGSDRRWAVAASVAVGVAVVAMAILALRPDAQGPAEPTGDAPSTDPQALTRAESACDLTTKAGEAAEAVALDERSRFAAAVLLLDRAILDSARAAQSDARLGDLDAALQAVHTAGHDGDPDRWQSALDTALAECRAVLG